ncbi:MAG: 6-carboxytetrahydropterin synthase QueD [Verrucomicrobia bacterium]|jgi:6-pyruvoyltetrahydropterin/6-carboxytetrahydropterin synthase|nr:6-carboxytetrahydropterin synthase QueD [Verrucomicrobiota bacterium]
MYELGITTNFSAAHHLVAYPGACAVLHGHNWKIEIFVRGETLDELGMLIDFKELKGSVSALMEELDHTDLNTHPEFVDLNPTSERIAHFLYRRLSEDADGDRYKIARVTVHETPGSLASYWE